MRRILPRPLLSFDPSRIAAGDAKTMSWSRHTFPTKAGKHPDQGKRISKCKTFLL